MNDLKKCPFCGGDAEIFSTGDCWEKTFYRIHCKNFCCTQIHFYSNENDAIEAWNKRTNKLQLVQNER